MEVDGVGLLFWCCWWMVSSLVMVCCVYSFSCRVIMVNYSCDMCVC